MKRLSKELVKQIEELYVSGFGKILISKKLGISIPSINKYLISGGIKSRPGSKRLVDINPFENLSNPDVQYWIGWIVSDGNIHDKRISLTTTKKDYDIARKYCDFIGLDYSNIKEHKRQNTNWDIKCDIRFGNAEIVKFLNSLGITEAKSKIISLNIPITFDMLRGLMDGDGHYSSKKGGMVIYTSASLDLISQISEFLKENKIVSGYAPNGSCYNLRIKSNCIESFIKQLYYDENVVCSNRKRKTVDEILKIRNELNLYGETLRNKKRVLQYDINKNFIKEYLCINDILIQNENYTRGALSQCLIGNNKSAYNNIWKYKDKQDE